MLAASLCLLLSCVSFGAAIVATLIAPRALSPLAALGGLVALAGGATAVGVMTADYGAARATPLAVVTIIAGVASGFAVAAAALPHLAGPEDRIEEDARDRQCAGRTAVVLVSYGEPERYAPRTVAARHRLLSESAGIDVPVTALPFVFFAEKSRYRAVGGVAPGFPISRSLRAMVEERLAPSVSETALVWCHTPGNLADTVLSLYADGVDRLCVIPVGTPASGPLDLAMSILERRVRRMAGLTVVSASPIWADRDLPHRLASRVLTAADDTPVDSLGVVLAGQGMPPVWEKRYATAAEAENYLDQRVRMLLIDHGVQDRHVRVAWIEWQTPDVTEAVRHLAALGCTRIIVTCSTIALPTLDTALDLGHEIRMARVPEAVEVVTLGPWGDDPALADAIARAAADALQSLDR